MMNLSESYNVVLINARRLLMIALVEKNFYNCIGYFVARNEEVINEIEKREELTQYASQMLKR